MMMRACNTIFAIVILATSTQQTSARVIDGYLDEYGDWIEVRKRNIENMMSNLPEDISIDDLKNKMEIMRMREELINEMCECYCRRKWEESEWVCCDCAWTEKACFPGSAHVTLQSGDVIKMADLNVGDIVMTLSEAGVAVPTPVLAFLSRSPSVLGLYRRLTTSSGASLSLSQSHLIFRQRSNVTSSHRPEAVFAARIQEGDVLFRDQGGKQVPDTVVRITEEFYRGAHVPLTDHGTLLVDGVLASCYASFDHQVAHTALAPLRWLPGFLTNSLPFINSDHPYVYALKIIGRWLLEGDQVHKYSESEAQEHVSTGERVHAHSVNDETVWGVDYNSLKSTNESCTLASSVLGVTSPIHAHTSEL